MIKPTKRVYIKPQSIAKECKILPKSAADKTPELLFFSPKPNTTVMYNLQTNRQVGEAYFVLKNTFIYIAELFINKYERGKGYGTKFLDYIQNLSRANGRNGNMRVYAALQRNETIPPHLFYAKYGFKSKDLRVQKKLDNALKTNLSDPRDLKLGYEPMEFTPDKTSHCIGIF